MSSDAASLDPNVANIIIRELQALADLDPTIQLPDELFMNRAEPKDPVPIRDRPGVEYYITKENFTGIHIPPDRIGIMIRFTKPAELKRKIFLYETKAVPLQKAKDAWRVAINLLLDSTFSITSSSYGIDARTGTIWVPPEKP